MRKWNFNWKRNWSWKLKRNWNRKYEAREWHGRMEGFPGRLTASGGISIDLLRPLPSSPLPASRDRTNGWWPPHVHRTCVFAFFLPSAFLPTSRAFCVVRLSAFTRNSFPPILPPSPPLSLSSFLFPPQLQMQGNLGVFETSCCPFLWDLFDCLSATA